MCGIEIRCRTEVGLGAIASGFRRSGLPVLLRPQKNQDLLLLMLFPLILVRSSVSINQSINQYSIRNEKGKHKGMIGGLFQAAVATKDPKEDEKQLESFARNASISLHRELGIWIEPDTRGSRLVTDRNVLVVVG